MISLSCKPDVYDKSSALLKAMAHPNRLQIIDRLHKDGSSNVTSYIRSLSFRNQPYPSIWPD